jgi:hypothetical protein
VVEIQFKYRVGQAVRERASSGSGAVPRKFIVAVRGYFEGQPAYILNEADTGDERGWFSEDMLESYDPTPAPHPGRRPSAGGGL